MNCCQRGRSAPGPDLCLLFRCPLSVVTTVTWSVSGADNEITVIPATIITPDTHYSNTERDILFV